MPGYALYALRAVASFSTDFGNVISVMVVNSQDFRGTGIIRSTRQDIDLIENYRVRQHFSLIIYSWCSLSSSSRIFWPLSSVQRFSVCMISRQCLFDSSSRFSVGTRGVILDLFLCIKCLALLNWRWIFSRLWTTQEKASKMSYCYFYGIVPVSDGRRVQSIRANGGTTWHMIYDTMFVTESGSDVDGNLRAFAPASSSILQSSSLTIVQGKFTIPPVGKEGKMPEFTIEAIGHQPFLADPTKDDFDSFLPEDTLPFFSVLGTVVGSVVQMDDSGRAVDIRVSSYVQNKTVDCMIRYC